MTKKILVADDSITIQKIVAMAFEKEDALVEGVGNGKDAFHKMEDFQPDIVLADVDMPGLTGFELSKKIKGDPKLNLLRCFYSPVILKTLMKIYIKILALTTIFLNLLNRTIL